MMRAPTALRIPCADLLPLHLREVLWDDQPRTAVRGVTGNPALAIIPADGPHRRRVPLALHRARFDHAPFRTRT